MNLWSPVSAFNLLLFLNNKMYCHIVSFSCLSFSSVGTVGCDKGVVYFMPPGYPADIGLQFGKACYPCRW